MEERDLLEEYKIALSKLSDVEKKERDIYLRNIGLGKIMGPVTGYPSIDKPWLKWYKEEYLNLPFQKTNAFDYFLEETKKFPNACVLDYYGRRYTRSDIETEVNEYIKKFKAMGIKKGDTVSFVMLNTPEAIFMSYALIKLGAVSNMIKFDESGERIKYMTELTKSKYLIASEVPFILSNVKKALDESDQLEQVVTVSLTESLPIGLVGRMVYDELQISHLVKQGLTNNVKKDATIIDLAKALKEQLLELKKSNEEIKKITKNDKRFIQYKEWIKEKSYSSSVMDKGAPEDVAVIVYTGGTTGQPKGVCLTNNNLNAMAHNLKYGEYDFDFGKTSLNILPPAIAYFFNATHGNMCSGVEVHLVSHFTPEEYPYLLRKYRPNIFMSGPILLENMRKADVLEDTSFMVAPISGGDKLYETEEALDNEYIKATGGTATVHQGWGMSEGTAASSYMKTNAYKLGSIGIPFIDLVVSVFEYRTDKELKYAEVGELCITGPTIMAMYLNNPEATNGVLLKHQDGRIWLHTDDLGVMDSEGRLFHKGRAKRMLTRRGGKVWLSEIEELASKNPAIDKCSGVKMDDEVEREVPVLHLVLKDNSINIEDVVRELDSVFAKELSDNYIPKYYVVREELPYSEVNKKCDFKALEKENILDETEYEINGKIIIKKVLKLTR